MINPRNFVIIEGGLTRDPEVFENKVVQFSIGVDNAGLEKGETGSGYFDIKGWLTSSKFSPEASAENLRKALEDKTLVKGARVSVVGRLSDERWTGEGNKKNRKTVIVAENVTVLFSKTRDGSSNSLQDNPATSVNIDSF